jgi:hypothetical protein
MKIEPRKGPVAEEATHSEDTTTEFKAGPQRLGHRRTTVTVERETVSFLLRRPVTPEANEPEPPDNNLPAAALEMLNELSGGKP